MTRPGASRSESPPASLESALSSRVSETVPPIFLVLFLVGAHSAEFFHNAGGKVIAIVEYNGYIHNADGIDIIKLRKHMNENRTIIGFPGATSYPGNGKAGLELECDVLIPAALEQQLTKDNARNVSVSRFQAYVFRSRPRSLARVPTAPPRRRPTRSSTSAALSFFPICT